MNRTSMDPSSPRAKLNGSVPPRNAKAGKPEVADSDIYAEAMRRYNEARDYMMSVMAAPGWKRTLVAFVTTLAVGFGAGWALGTALDWLITGAVLMSAPSFLVVVTYVLGLLTGAYFVGKLAVRVGGSILTGEADARALAAYDAMKAKLCALNPFARREIVGVKAR